MHSAIETNEEKFRNDVFDVLNNVAEKLRNAERFRLYKSTFGASHNDTNMEEKFQYEYILRMFNEVSLAERINLKELNLYLKAGLADKDIEDRYTYGVYSATANSFVIQNGHYAVTGNSQNVVHALQNEGLYNSDFKVNIFDSSNKEPGLLMIYFPDRSFYAPIKWIALSSLLFTMIILGTFIYTIYEILRQKKLSLMKNDFINNMTHEFKTPIATISLASDSIANPNIISDPIKINRFLNIIQQENTRMLHQVEKVLQMAMLEKQRIRLNVAKVNLHEVIKSAVEHINLQVEQKNGYIETDLEADPCVIEGDITHITSMVHNLLDNANKYSLEYPQISVSTRNTAEGIDVIVEDKGIGMTREQKKQIFDKFYRATSGNLHDVKGFGLGLSYVKAMMLAHQGQVEVVSELGKGSIFTLSFPLLQHKDD